MLNIWVEQTLCEFKKNLLLCEYCIQFFAYYTILFNFIHQRMFGFLSMVNCFLSHHRIKYHLYQIHGEKNNTRHLKRFLNWISSKTSIVYFRSGQTNFTKIIKLVKNCNVYWNYEFRHMHLKSPIQMNGWARKFYCTLFVSVYSLLFPKLKHVI